MPLHGAGIPAYCRQVYETRKAAIQQKATRGTYRPSRRGRSMGQSPLSLEPLQALHKGTCRILRWDRVPAIESDPSPMRLRSSCANSSPLPVAVFLKDALACLCIPCLCVWRTPAKQRSQLHPALAIEAPIEALEEMPETARYSQRWPLGTSPSCRVFNNAMSLISPTL